VSPEGWARFEERARRRRVERWLEDARNAANDGRLAEARAAMEEARELDPQHADLSSIGKAIGRGAARARGRKGAWVGAAAALTGLIFGATTELGDVVLLRSHRLIDPSQLTSQVVPEVGTTWTIAEGWTSDDAGAYGDDIDPDTAGPLVEASRAPESAVGSSAAAPALAASAPAARRLAADAPRGPIVASLPMVLAGASVPALPSPDLAAAVPAARAPADAPPPATLAAPPIADARPRVAVRTTSCSVRRSRAPG
jgi:hypothetical protein